MLSIFTHSMSIVAKVRLCELRFVTEWSIKELCYEDKSANMCKILIIQLVSL